MKPSDKSPGAPRRARPSSLITAAALALVLTLIAGLGALSTPDLALSDLIYQRHGASDGQIVLVGIDQRALEALGPYGKWDRSVFARALEALNAPEDDRPAVIGIDVLFTGASSPEADEALARAAEKYGNVVTASAAEFGGVEADGAGSYHIDSFSIQGFDEPYAALRDVTTQGHVNAMLDSDGVLRHAMLELRLPDGRTVPSFALTIARRYREATGQPEPELPETNSRGFWYLPYTGLPGAYSESISIADLLDGSVPSDHFRGKIVLIGPYAAGLGDSYVTAVDHARPMYGMEVQANTIEAILRADYPREAGTLPQLAALFFILLLSFFLFYKRHALVSAPALAVIILFWTGLCAILRNHGILLHVLWVPAGAALVYLITLAAGYIRSRLETRRVRAAFERYVAPEIVRELLKAPDALELTGKTTEIAVLFVDVRGFTSMSEVLTPVNVVAILNRYLTLISDCILRHGGTLDKFVGDAAMAFWGAPLPCDDAVLRAARAATDMVEGSRELSEELMAEFGRTVSFGIGIHVGMAVVGNVGSPKRMDYTAIGDTVNTAARLEANAPGGKIYISRAVADALGDNAAVTSLGDTVPLKGKKAGFEVLTLDSLTGP